MSHEKKSAVVYNLQKVATLNTGMVCSICLRNTQNWNCLGRDYRFRRWSSGRERKERKSSWGHPPTALSRLTSASPQALCQMITLRSLLYARVAALIHFQQIMHLLLPTFSFLFNWIWGRNQTPSFTTIEHPKSKMTKSKKSEILKNTEAFHAANPHKEAHRFESTNWLILRMCPHIGS